MPTIEIFAKRSIPPKVLETVLATFGPDAPKFRQALDKAEQMNSSARIEEAEQDIAKRVYRDAVGVEGNLASSFGEETAPVIMMDLAAMLYGSPFGAHRHWLDRLDISLITRYPATHVSTLTRQGLFDVIEYGRNATHRGVKRWATRDSVEMYQKLRTEGMGPSDILEYRMRTAPRLP